jgi:hypothetical protein
MSASEFGSEVKVPTINGDSLAVAPSPCGDNGLGLALNLAGLYDGNYGFGAHWDLDPTRLAAYLALPPPESSST